MFTVGFGTKIRRGMIDAWRDPSSDGGNPLRYRRPPYTEKDAVEDPHWKSVRDNLKEERSGARAVPPLVFALMEADIRREGAKKLVRRSPSIISVLRHVRENTPLTWSETHVLITTCEYLEDRKELLAQGHFSRALDDFSVGAAVDCETARCLAQIFEKDKGRLYLADLLGDHEREMRGRREKEEQARAEEEAAILRENKREAARECNRKRREEAGKIRGQLFRDSLAAKVKKEQDLRDNKRLEGERQKEWEREARDFLENFPLSLKTAHVRLMSVNMTHDSEFSARYAAFSAIRILKNTIASSPGNSPLIRALWADVLNKVEDFERVVEENKQH